MVKIDVQQIMGKKPKYNNWQGNLASGSDKVRKVKS